jgi:tRNA(fMet)-specific endonuclease VapC
MYILDTDHLSVLERGGTGVQRLAQRLREVPTSQVSATIISYEEQTRGWLARISKVNTEEQEVKAYKHLKAQLNNYCMIPVIEFDLRAVQEFHRLKKIYRRLGTMDLKIASIAIVNQSVLLTRNFSDFQQIAGLLIENWTE